VQLECRACDEAGERTSAWITAIVVDERYRTREPNPVAHFFIAGDVQSGEDLDNAALLSADTPAARHALDLFLGTVGWRHFERTADKEVAAARMPDAVLFGQQSASPQQLEQQHETQVKAALVPVRAAVEAKHADLLLARQVAQSVLDSARAELRDFEALPMEYFRVGLGATTLLLLVMACLILGVGAWRLVRRHQATLLFAGSFACLGLCLMATLLLVSLGPPTESINPRLAQPRDGIGALALNFAPRVDVPTGPPAGEFALAVKARGQVDREERLLADTSARDDRKDFRFGEFAEGKKHGSPQRGAGSIVPSAAKDGDAKKGPLAELVARYQLALLKQDAFAAGKPSTVGPAPSPPPGATTDPPKVVAMDGPGAKGKSAPPETQTETEQASLRRAWVYEKVPGLEYDTLLWHPSLLLTGGSGQVAFDVPASAGNYRVLLFGNTADGRLGFYEGRLEVQPDLGR
jgi:hypothetical protein